MKKIQMIKFLAIPAAAFIFASCDTPAENAREDAAETTADAMEERADAVRDQDNSGALGTTGDAAEAEADAIEERADDVRDAAE